MNKRINATVLLADSYSPLTSSMVLPMCSQAGDICFSQGDSFLKLDMTKARYENKNGTKQLRLLQTSKSFKIR